MILAPAGYKRVLVPVDFSPASAHALGYALALGDAFSSVVDALHVWRTNTETPVNVARERAKEELRAFTSAIGPRGKAILRRRTDYGDPYLTILRIAQLSSYDLVVAAAPHAGSSADHLGLGLTHAARVPVLLVPSAWVESRKEPDLERHLQRILLPAAFAARSPTAAAQAFGLAEAFGATVEVLVARDPRAEAEQASFLRTLAEEPKWQERAERHEMDLALDAALTLRAEEGGYDFMVVSAERGAVDQRGADPLLSRLLPLQRCPTLCERWD